MSDPTVASPSSLVKSIRITLAVSGAIALIAGIVLLVWPGKSLGVITGVFAVYLIIAGLVYIGLGIFSAARSGWARVGHIVLGLLYIVAGVIAFTNLRETGTFLAFVIVIFIGVSWIVDGVVSLTLLGSDGSRVWTLLFALLSIIAGIIVIVAPLESALILWVFLGVSLVVFGVVQIVRAITIGKDAKSLGSPVQPNVAG